MTLPATASSKPGDERQVRRARAAGAVARTVIVAVLLLLAWASWTGAQQDELSEYQLKAAFIYNFAKFVEWPGDAFADGSAPLRICVLGENPFGGELARTVEGKKINGRGLTVKQFSDSRMAKGCHVLFVSASERGHVPQVLDTLRDSSTLTVSETREFIRMGGMITFLMEDGKVRFEVNLRASEQARLKISSKLLSLARRVWSLSDGKG